MFKQKILLTTALMFFVNSAVILPVFSQSTPQNQSQTAKNVADSASVSSKNEEKNASVKQNEEGKGAQKANQAQKDQKKNPAASDNKEAKPLNKAEQEKTTEKAVSKAEEKTQKDSKAEEKTQQSGKESGKTEDKKPTEDKAGDENIATITAEGDFVVPTYMLPAANANGASPDGGARQDVKQPLPVAPEGAALGASNAPTVTVKELPVMKITQTELTPVSEQMAIERFLTGKTTKTTQMYKEALARQEQRMKEQERLNSSDVRDVSDILGEGTSSQEGVQLSAEKENMSGTIATAEKKTKKRLLLPLRPLPKKEAPAEDLSGTQPLFKVISSEMADKALSDAQQKTRTSVLMPQDIKVTFYPNSAEFSGQTVKWIKAFSLQALNDPRYIIEIRLSNKNQVIQQKRLFVVQRLLMNSGLSAHQIVVDYVNRPEDSLILRMISRVEDVQTRKETMKNGKVKQSETINW